MSSGARRPEVVCHADPEALCEAVAEEVAERLTAAISARRKATLVLAGGRTPRGVYERLAERNDLAWDRIVLVFGDERAVPPDDSHSNYRMVTEALAGPLARLEGRPVVRRMAGELGSKEAARQYSEFIDELVGPGERFDVVLLGMGDDGHVASIFPGTREERADGEGEVVIATTSPLPPLERVSLTLPVLGRTRALLMLVTGESKAARLAEVHLQIAEAHLQIEHAHGHGQPFVPSAGGHLPAARIAQHIAGDGIFRWHIDEAANAILREGST